MGDSTNQHVLSKRERAANKIRSFAGIRQHTYNNSSQNTTTSATASPSPNTFPSFRFSPESEEIHEVPVQSNLSGSVESLETNNGDGSTGSVPSSPLFRSPGGISTSGTGPGDTSPIKEYIKKNWANKFDKKSLSLDLDLKGKIITAIEDKRKSIVSHFIPEETGLVLPIAGIKEHTGISVGEHSQSLSQESRNNSSNSKIISFDNGKQEVTSNISQQPPQQASSSNSPNVKRSSSADHILGNSKNNAQKILDDDPLHDDDLDFEELGIDLTEIDNGSLEDLHDSAILGGINLSYLKWNYSREGLSAKYEYPEGIHIRESNSKLPPIAEPVTDEQLSIRTLGLNILLDIANHGLFKYFILLFGVGLCLPIGSNWTVLNSIYWFITGAIFSTILIQSLSSSTSSAIKNSGKIHPQNEAKTKPPIGANWSIIPRQITNSQTWLLEFDGDYEPINISFHNAKPVFARLQGSHLYLSNPSSGTRIPRRVTCTDPELPEIIEFSRHRIYNIEKATVFIAPEKLARRRVWNKKYPIGIKLCPTSQLTIVTKAEPGSGMRSAISDSAINVSHSPIHQNSVEEPGTKPKKPTRTISHETCGKSTLYLFTRTDREKEEWFRRLVVGTKGNSPDNSQIAAGEEMEKYYMDYMSKLVPPASRPGSSRASSTGTMEKVKSPNAENTNGGSVSEARNTPTPSGLLNGIGMERLWKEVHSQGQDSQTYLNAFLGRIFMNFLRSEQWTTEIHKLIQKKLNFIRRPPFLDVLILKKLDLGYTLPLIEKASKPVLDHRGLWIDLDISYEGEFCFVIETRIDIMKLRKAKKIVVVPEETEIYETPSGSGVEDQDDDSQAEDISQGSKNSLPLGNIYDSDADDSGEETSEDEFDPEAQFAENPELNIQSPFSNQALCSLREPATAGSKFLKLVERVANSSIVADMKMVQNAIGKVATTPISMIVQIKAANGVLVLNITPPPTDRLWFGFRYNPEINIVAKPQIGLRVVNINRITDWIGNKIRQQLTKVIVFPNMDEITIPLMEFQLPS